MLFGGNHDSYKTQISIVESCRLRRLGTLPMKFKLGACNTFQTSEGDEEVLLCFARTGKNECHRLSTISQRSFKPNRLAINKIRFRLRHHQLTNILRRVLDGSRTIRWQLEVVLVIRWKNWTTQYGKL